MQIQNSGKRHELPRKSIIFLTYLGVGSFRGHNFKTPGNFMNCREDRYMFCPPPPPPTGGGGFYGSKFQSHRNFPRREGQMVE